MLCLDTSGYGYSKTLCRKVCEWFMNDNFPRHSVYLDVVHRGLKREGVYGSTTVMDCDWRPRDFLIEMQSNLNKDDYITVILHELQHCLQHIRGDLRDKRGIRCWKGIDCSELDYENSPWEIEAYQKEKELYENYKKYLTCLGLKKSHLKR